MALWRQRRRTQAATGLRRRGGGGWRDLGEKEATREDEVEARRARKRNRLRNWAIAKTMEQACNLLLAVAAIWILGKAIQAGAEEAPLMKDRRNVMTIQDTAFDAYDCAAPRNISSVELHTGRRECRDEELQGEQRPKKYLLLQKAKRIAISVKLIDATYAKLVFVCGSASHTALASRELRFGLRYQLNERQAQEIWRTLKWRRPHEQPKVLDKVRERGTKEWEPANLRVGQYNDFHWQKVGLDYHGGNDVNCKGQPLNGKNLWSYPPKDMTNAVMTYQMKVGLFFKSAFWIPTEEGSRQGKIQLESGEILPCAATTGGCVTSHGTYLWQLPAEYDSCPYHLTRRTEGVDVVERDEDGNPTGEVTYLSTDKSMIMLRKEGRPRAACGGVITATNFPQLFLTEDIEHDRFQKEIHASEASPYLYADMGDQFVHERVQDDIKRAVLGLQRNACHRDAVVRNRQYARKAAEQQVMADGGTAHLGGGTFFTARGDGGFVYTCRKVVVNGVKPQGRCFNALEVKLPNREEQLYRQYHGLNTEDARGNRPELPRFFLEPKTHRLLTTAKEEKCLDALAPLYKNNQGKWVAVKSSGLDLAVPPVRLEDGFSDGFQYAKSHIDAAEGGVYDPTTREAITYYLQAGQAEVAVLGGMVRQYQSKHHGRLYTPDDELDMNGFFANAPSSDALNFLTSMNWAWWYLVQYGRLASILLSCALLFRLLKYFIGVLTRICSPPKTPSSALHILGAFFPELTEFLVSGKYRPNGPRGPFREVVAACASRRDLATPVGSDEEDVERFRRQKQRRHAKRERRQQAKWYRGRTGAMDTLELANKEMNLYSVSVCDGGVEEGRYPVRQLEQARRDQRRLDRRDTDGAAGGCAGGLTDHIYAEPRTHRPSADEQQVQQPQQQEQVQQPPAEGAGAERLNVQLEIDRCK